MTPAQVTELLRLVPRWYPHFAVGMTEEPIWLAALAPFTPEDALQALKDWWHWHGDAPPTLDEFVQRLRRMQQAKEEK